MRSVAERFIREPDTASFLNENGLWGEVTNPELWSVPQLQENIAILTTLAEMEYQREPELLTNGSDRRAREQSVFDLIKLSILAKEKNTDTLRIHIKLFFYWIRRNQLHKE